MSKRTWRELGDAIGDVLKETSWPMRIGVLIGIGAGFWLTFLLLTSNAADESGWFARRIFVVLSLVIICVCGFLGIALGALLDSLFSPEDKKKK